MSRRVRRSRPMQSRPSRCLSWRPTLACWCSSTLWTRRTSDQFVFLVSFFFFFSFIVLKPWSSWTKFHSGHGIVPLLGGKRDFAQQEIPGPPSWKDLLQLLQLRRSAPKAGRNQKVFPFIQIAEVVLSFLTFVRFLFFLFFFASEASC